MGAAAAGASCRNRDLAYNPAASFADIQITEGAESDFQGAKYRQRRYRQF